MQGEELRGLERALGKTLSLKFELIRQEEARELLAGAAGAEGRSSYSSESLVTGEQKSGGHGRRGRQGPCTCCYCSKQQWVIHHSIYPPQSAQAALPQRRPSSVDGRGPMSDC